MELLFNESAGYEKDYEQAHAVLAMRSPESSPEDRQLDIQFLRQQTSALMRKHLVALIVLATLLEQRGQLTSREVREAVYRNRRETRATLEQSAATDSRTSRARDRAYMG